MASNLLSQQPLLRSIRTPASKSLSRPLSWLLIAAMVATQFAGLLAFPATPVQAQAPEVQPNIDSTASDSAISIEVEPAQAPTIDKEIIYIDSQGFIRVIDPFVPADRVPIRWVSPTGGWQDFAVGDVNGDGDMEIIAIAETSGIIRLTVYDPVVASGAISDPSRIIDGVPWDILYETTFNGAAPLVASGNFDRAIFADEIFVGYRPFSGGFRALVLNAESLNPNTQRPTGRDWKIHVDQILEVPFDYVDTGDVTGNGLDDIVLVETDSLPDGAFRVYEAENNFRFLGRFGRSNSSFFNVALGNVIPGGGAEIVTSSTAGNRINLFVVQRLPNGNLDAGENQYQFVPSPRFVFLADLTGNGDKELFFLRVYDGTDRDRLIMRNEWGTDVNDTATFEVRLDNDNGYRVGAGGDFNGNGREEIAIMRNDRIRLYTEPVRGPSSFTDFVVDTNSRSIRFANLDAVGFTQGPQIQVTPDRIDATVEFGAAANIGQISIANVSTPESVQVSAQALNPNGTIAGFISFTPVSGATPVNLGVRINAAGLREGVYTGVIRITSPNTNVVNLPIEIPFSVTVLAPPPPGFNPSAGGTGFFYYPCEAYFQALVDDPNGENGNGENAGFSPATLMQPTMPQTVTVRFSDTPGATGGGGQVTMAVIDAPDGPGSAETGATGAPAAIVDAYVDHNGDVVLVDAEGGRTLVEMSGPEIAAVDNFIWPSLVPWVTSVRSDRNAVPFQVELVGDLYPVIRDMEPTDYIRRAAMLVVVGEQLYGPPPRNVRVVSLSLVCTNRFLGMPSALNLR